MDELRREKIRGLIQMLESIEGQARDYFLDEEAAFESRSLPSKETEQGIVSKEAVESLEQAVGDIENAIYQLRLAIGDESLPEPTQPTIIRRRI
jgi:hypothetical protein